MDICKESFQITGTYFGLFPRKVYPGTELVPVLRRNISTRTVGPVETSPATEEDSWVVYQEFEYGKPLEKFYVITKSNFHGWILLGKEILPFSEKEYLMEVEGHDAAGFNSDNSMKTVHYPLRGDERKFVVVNNGTYNYPEYTLEEELVPEEIVTP